MDTHNGSADAYGQAPPEKKRRILQACLVCSAKRVKCDGQRPCSTCVRNGDQCGYAIPKKRGPPKGSTRASRKSQSEQNAQNEDEPGSSSNANPSVSASSSSTSKRQQQQQAQAAQQQPADTSTSAHSTDARSSAYSLPPVPLSGPPPAAPHTDGHLTQLHPSYSQRLSDWSTAAVPPPEAPHFHSRHSTSADPTMYAQQAPMALPSDQSLGHGQGPHQPGQPDTSSSFFGGRGPGSSISGPGPAHLSLGGYSDSRTRPAESASSQLSSHFHPPPPAPIHHGAPAQSLTGPPPLPPPAASARRGMVSQHPPSQHLAPSHAGAPPPDLAGWFGNKNSTASSNGNNAVGSNSGNYYHSNSGSASATNSGSSSAAALRSSGNHPALSQRSAYPSSQEASSHSNLPLPRQARPNGPNVLTPLSSSGAASADLTVGTADRFKRGPNPASVPAGPGSIPGPSTSSRSTSHFAKGSTSAPNRGTMSSDASASDTSGAAGAASGPNVSRGGALSGSSGATSGVDSGAEAPSRFFRGGTSGLHGLATRLRDRDRYGPSQEAAGGVVLRTFSGDRNGADDIGEEIHASPYPTAQHGPHVAYQDGHAARRHTDGRARTKTHEWRESDTGPSHAGGGRAGAVGSHEQPAYASRDAHERHERSTTMPGLSQAYSSHAAHGGRPDVGPGPSRVRDDVDHAQPSGGPSGSAWRSAESNLDMLSAASATAAEAQSARGPAPAAAAGPAARPAATRDANSGHVSMAGGEDDPRLHEVMWKAASSELRSATAVPQRPQLPQRANTGGSSGMRPLHEMSEPYLDEAVAAYREELEDLQLAVGDVGAPDFTSPLVSAEVEQKLLHLWIANIGTHWTPVAPPTHDDIDAQPFEPKSSSEKHRKEAYVQQVLTAWRAILQPERRPLLWNAILSMAADAWGGDLAEPAYPSKSTASSALSANKTPDEDESKRELDGDREQNGDAQDGKPAAAAANGDGEPVNRVDESVETAGRFIHHRKSMSGDLGWGPPKSMHLIGKVRTGRQLSTALFIRAKFFLQKTNQEATLEAIQASVFMALRESGAGRASQAAHYSTNACRMALDLGLHRHKAVKRAMGPAFTRHEDESRRRTLWCAYILDKVIAFILGRPAILRYAEIDCPFPSEDMPDEEMPWVVMAERFISPAILERMQGVPSMVASTAKFASQLACIGEKIIEQYNIVKPTDWQRWVKCIHVQLNEWHSRLRPEVLNPEKHLPHSMNQLMWFHTLRILLHRPHILKEVTDPEMPSSHKECTEAVTRVCELLSIYETFYNVRKVSTSLAFILFTSVTIALSNTTSNDPAVVAEAKQRLHELIRWFKKASEHYRAARHHLSIINVLAEGIEVGTGAPVHHRDDDDDAAETGPGGPNGEMSGGGGVGQTDGSLAAAAGPPEEGTLAYQIYANESAPPSRDGRHVTTGNFTGFAHSGANYAYPAETLAAAQAAYRGRFVMPNNANGAVAAGEPAAELPGGAADGPANAGGTATMAAGAGADGSGPEMWAANRQLEGIPTVPQVPTAGGNPLDFLDSQAYLNLQSEAYWGAMPVSSENLLLWNTFHNEYLSALASCAVDQSTAAAGPVNNSAVTNALANAVDAGPSTSATADANVVPNVLDQVSVAGVAAGVYSIFHR